MIVRQFLYIDEVKLGIYIFPEVPIKIYGAGYFLDFLSPEQFNDLLNNFRWGRKEEVDNILDFIGYVDKHLVKVWPGYYIINSGKMPTRKSLISGMCIEDGGNLAFRLEQRLPAKHIRVSYGRDKASNTGIAKTFKRTLEDYKIPQGELIENMWKLSLVKNEPLRNRFYLGRSGVINMLGFYAAGYHGVNMLNNKYKYLL